MREETLKQRQLFCEYYDKVPLMLGQGSVGDRIKRGYTNFPPKPLKQTGLVYTPAGKKGLEDCFGDYVDIAQKYELPMFIRPYGTTTCRTRAELIGTLAEGRDTVVDNIDHCLEVCKQHTVSAAPVFIAPSLMFSGDAYKPDTAMGEEEAYSYYKPMVERVEQSDVTAARNGLTPTLTDIAGAARALSESTLPYFITFMVKKNGKLLDGTWVNDAMEYLEEVTHKRPPLFYQVNCVHPRNMYECLMQPKNCTRLVRTRFLALEGNGSPLSPDELDNSAELFTTPPEEWADDMMRLYNEFGFKVLGGCCGTENAHIDALARRIRKVWDEKGVKLL